jgi:thioredoxin-dependent peroxiredoxin
MTKRKSASSTPQSHIPAGDVAPDFTLPDDQDRPTSLSQFRGRTVVLFFYPKDNTPG